MRADVSASRLAFARDTCEASAPFPQTQNGPRLSLTVRSASAQRWYQVPESTPPSSPVTGAVRGRPPSNVGMVIGGRQYLTAPGAPSTPAAS
jgi:hypothetical protein